MEEAAASLKSYLDLLKELGQKPSSDVLHLAEKLGIPLDSTLTAELALKTDETKTETEKELEKIFRMNQSKPIMKVSWME